MSEPKPQYKVSIRGGFSDRNGIRTENTEIQVRSLDHRTRVAFMNAINNLYYSIMDYEDYSEEATSFWRSVRSTVYSLPVNYSKHTVYDIHNEFDIINQTIMLDDYDSVLSLMEFLVNRLIDECPYKKEHIAFYINSVLEKDYVGYRFIDKQIVPIVDQVEVDAISEAVNNPYLQVQEHLKKSLAFISDRDHPDYSNSVKESISAVEALCSIISGKGTSLGKALDKIQKDKIIDIHPSLKEGFDKLFGYTSNAAGIRHAGQIDGDNTTFEEAKFMLVSCSAFVNYLMGALAKVDDP